MTDWQPIETAPKDGTAVLLAGMEVAYPTPLVGLWLEPTEVGKHLGWSGWIDPDQGNDLGHPTHWMTLPALPLLW